MTLLEKIKQDQVDARKSADRATELGKVRINALTTLIGEASPAGNATVSDEDIQKVVRKFVKNLDEALAASHDRAKKISETSNNKDVLEILKGDVRHCNMLFERQLYMAYLPQVFDSDDIRAIIENIGDGNVGKIMAACKKAAQEQGKMFDGALVKKEMAEYEKKWVHK